MVEKLPTVLDKLPQVRRGRFFFTRTVYDHDTSALHTYRQTDGQTTFLGNTALRVALRGKNRSIYDALMKFSEIAPKFLCFCADEIILVEQSQISDPVL